MSGTRTAGQSAPPYRKRSSLVVQSLAVAAQELFDQQMLCWVVELPADHFPRRRHDQARHLQPSLRHGLAPLLLDLLPCLYEDLFGLGLGVPSGLCLDLLPDLAGLVGYGLALLAARLPPEPGLLVGARQLFFDGLGALHALLDPVRTLVQHSDHRLVEEAPQ